METPSVEYHIDLRKFRLRKVSDPEFTVIVCNLSPCTCNRCRAHIHSQNVISKGRQLSRIRAIAATDVQNGCAFSDPSAEQDVEAMPGLIVLPGSIL
jgi:hypothetical protein